MIQVIAQFATHPDCVVRNLWVFRSQAQDANPRYFCDALKRWKVDQSPKKKRIMLFLHGFTCCFWIVYTIHSWSLLICWSGRYEMFAAGILHHFITITDTIAYCRVGFPASFVAWILGPQKAPTKTWFLYMLTPKKNSSWTGTWNNNHQGRTPNENARDRLVVTNKTWWPGVPGLGRVWKRLRKSGTRGDGGIWGFNPDPTKSPHVFRHRSFQWSFMSVKNMQTKLKTIVKF